MVSRSSSPSIDRKPESSGSSQNSTSFGVKQPLGSIGGIDIEARAKIDVGNILPKQGISVDYDAEKNTTSVGIGIGSTRSKLGVAIGAEYGVNEDGSTSIKSVSGGINVAGFGVEGKAGADGSGGIGVSAFGITVDVEKDAQGRVSGGISIKIPGGEIGIGFAPNEGKQVPGILPTPIPPESGVDPSAGITIPSISQLVWVPCVVLRTNYNTLGGVSSWSESRPTIANKKTEKIDGTYLPYEQTTRQVSWNAVQGQREDSAYVTPKGIYIYTMNVILSNASDPRGYYDYEEPAIVRSYKTWLNGGMGGFLDTGININKFLNINNSSNSKYLGDSRAYTFGNAYIFTFKPIDYIVIGDIPLITIQLPNYPQTLKPMDCCEKVEEIYRYLGIAKIKKNKFKVAKQFLVPKSQGDEMCEDYYSINEALFRMLANGLIINPVSKPLGSPWQNVNATAWAAEIYEMVAESRSDGNSTQVFEMHAAAQLVQLAKIVAELSRKVEFLSEALGYEPSLSEELLPVMFTVHEAHKGFDKKQPPKEIDISKPKTDEQVEAVLAKMIKPSKIPIVKWEFNPNHISINQVLNTQ